MNWIDGIHEAIDYIEDNITEKIDYDELGKISYSSPYHFQRIFSILCGYTVGEYIRFRRLSLAGSELAAEKIKVIDAAVKYGYDSADSFSRAFLKFHGITPSEARKPNAELRSFSRLSIKISLEGGNIVNYRIEKKPALTLTGLKQQFTGNPTDRYNQQHDFMVSGETRFVRYALQGMANNCTEEYSAVSNFTDNTYDFLIGNIVKKGLLRNLGKNIGEENAETLTVMEIPEQTYLIVETERNALSILEHLDLRKKVISEYFTASDYYLADSPEITVFHAFEDDKDSSYIELWLPIEKT